MKDLGLSNGEIWNAKQMVLYVYLEIYRKKKHVGDG